MFAFKTPEKDSKDGNNRKNINSIVKNYFSLNNESQKYFKKELLTPTLPDEIATLLELSDDLRVSREIEDRKSLEEIDEGWNLFCNYFKQFRYFHNFEYKQFTDGKILIKKNYVKTRKALVKFYTNVENYRSVQYDFNFDFYDIYKEVNYSEENKKKIITVIDRRLNKIGTSAIPKKRLLKITISANFADWFLCATKEKWTSCLSLSSNYDFAYWAGLPGLIGDKNRVMVYISKGKEKNYNGIKVDSCSSRTWGILSKDNKIILINWYPHRAINAAVINEAFDTDIFLDEDEGGGWVSKYPIKPLYDLNGNSRFIYQDYSDFEFFDYKLHIVENGESTYSFHNESDLVLNHHDLYRINSSLTRIIEHKSTVLDENKNDSSGGNSFHCDECGDDIYEGEEISFDGCYLCEGCYEELVVYTSDDYEKWRADCTFVESTGEWYTNNYVLNNFVTSVHDGNRYLKEDCYEILNDFNNIRYISIEEVEKNSEGYTELHDGMLIHTRNAIFDEQEQVYYSRTEWTKIHKNQLKLFTA